MNAAASLHTFGTVPALQPDHSFLSLTFYSIRLQDCHSSNKSGIREHYNELIKSLFLGDKT